jgi:solute carrier family 35 protein
MVVRGDRDDDESAAQPLVAGKGGAGPAAAIDAAERGAEVNDPKVPLWIVILYYTLASGTLLVINKVAIVALPAPTFVLLAQLLFSAIAVLVAHWFGAVVISKATPRQLMHFLPVVGGFLGTIYANIKVLQHSNVETFITFRSSTPLVLAFCDWAFLGRALPSQRSWAALSALLLSSAGYAYYDRGFVVDAYIWLFIWYVFFTFEGVWVKHVSIHLSCG